MLKQVFPKLLSQFLMENYDLWVVRMEAVEEDYEVLPLLDNPTMAHIKSHEEKKMKGKSEVSIC